MKEIFQRKANRNMTFDKQMIRFITWALVISTLLIISLSAVSTVSSLSSKSAQIAMREVEVMAANTEDNFEQYDGLIWAVMLDKNIQAYLKAKENQYEYSSDANSVLDNICNMWGNVNFISIIRSDGKGRLIKGNAIPNWLVNYPDNLAADFEKSLTMKKGNAMRMAYTKSLDSKGAYTLSLYYPLYSSTVIGQKLGELCINVDDANLNQLLVNGENDNKFAVNTYFFHENGEVISSTVADEIGTVFSQADILDQKQGKNNSGSHVLIYKKLDGWKFSYVTRISWWELIKDSVRTVMILAVLFGLILLITVRAARGMVTRAYQPWGNVVLAMGKASMGELNTRLAPLETDPDMKVVANGFNSMMEKFIKLMDQIKEEQYQKDQIKLEALHSQIQPHFLYNTLDCIHWQAVLDGNQEISQMVKALAAYYRLCLSKGKDIITIREEVEYIRNYLYIQKMRYGDILNYTIEADPIFENALIPKLTIQPLVENSIYHGIKLKGNQKGTIHIAITGNDERIRILIQDNGVGMSEDRINEINEMISLYDEEFGYGVRNVNRRIQLFYGEEYGLTYLKNESGGVTVQVLLPYTQKKQK